VKTSIADVNVVGNALVSMYAESGCMEEARKAFDQLYKRNILSTSSDIGATQRSNASRSSHTDGMDIGVSTFAFDSLLSAAANLGLLTKGQQLHALSVKSGLGSDKGVSNSLVSMYSRCGYLEDACRAFDEMKEHNVIL
jgi:pentatricopeptide repeat protein